MRHTALIVTAVLLSGLAARNAEAQWNIARFDENPNRAYTTFGLDPAFVGTVGYGRVVRVLDHNFQLTGDAGLATSDIDTDDFRVRIGLQTSVLQWQAVHLTGSLTSITRGTENSIYRGINFGADVTGAVGVYQPRWFASTEFGKDKSIVTHLTHTDWYRDNFYPDVKDGWYVDTGGTFHWGVTAGLSLGRTELVARFGWQQTERFDDLLSPYYGSLGLGYAF